MLTTQRTWNSLSDFVDEAAKTPNRTRHFDRSEWAGGLDLAEALDRAIEGWDEPRADIEAIVQRITPQIRKALTPRIENRVTARGRKVLPGRYAQGNPRCTMQRIRTETADNTRTVKVLANVSHTADVSADTIRQQGAALLALIDSLSYLGVSAEVWVCNNARNVMGETYGQAVKIKDMKDLAGLDRLMFAVAHPAMLRRLMFAAFDVDSAMLSRFPGYGGHQAPAVNGIDFDLVLGDNAQQAREITTNPVAWVLSTLSGLGLG